MEVQLVVFSLQEEEYGVPIDEVREIIRYVKPTAVPKAPASVKGVINLRGKVIPVVSLRERFGFSEKEIDDESRIIVAEVSGETMGFVVDAVTEVLRLDADKIEPYSDATSSVDERFIDGIGKVGDRLIIILDLAKLFDFTAIARIAG